MKDKWNVYKDLPLEKIYYRFEGASSLCSLYLEKVITAPIINVMAVLAEAQLYKEWVPTTKRSEVVA